MLHLYSNLISPEKERETKNSSIIFTNSTPTTTAMNCTQSPTFNEIFLSRAKVFVVNNDEELQEMHELLDPA